MKFRNLAKFVAVPAAFLSQTASAIDLTEVQKGVTQAVDDGTSVGIMVIGGVAGLIVVGVIVAMVKKLTA